MIKYIIKMSRQNSYYLNMYMENHNLKDNIIKITKDNEKLTEKLKKQYEILNNLKIFLKKI